MQKFALLYSKSNTPLSFSNGAVARIEDEIRVMIFLCEAGEGRARLADRSEGDLRSKWRAGQCVGIHIAGQQRELKEDHGRVPDRRPGQGQARDQGDLQRR